MEKIFKLTKSKTFIFFLLAFLIGVLVFIKLLPKPALPPAVKPEFGQLLSPPILEKTYFGEKKPVISIAFDPASFSFPTTAQVYPLSPLSSEIQGKIEALKGQTITLPTQDLTGSILEFLAQREIFPKILENAQVKAAFFRAAGPKYKEVKTPLEADLIQISIFPNLSNLPLLGNSPEETLLFLSLEKTGVIRKTQIKLKEIDLSHSSAYPLKNINEALNEVSQGEGKIVSLPFGRYQQVSPLPPQSINLSSIYLAYYLSEESRYLQPIFVFSGTAQLEGGQAAPVTLYLPAIASEWLIQLTPTPASRFKVE